MIPRTKSISFQESNIKHIKVKKVDISYFDLLSIRYIGIDFMKTRESALFRVLN